MLLTSNEVVRNYLREVPDIASRAAARVLYIKYPKRWPNWDSCYQSVRSIRGAHGRYRPAGEATEPASPFKLRCPEATVVPYDPFYLGNEIKVLRFSDIHVPFHCRETIELGVKWGREFCPDIVLLDGDIMDFSRLSKFIRRIEFRDPVEEMATAFKFFQYLRAAFRKAEIIIKWGNHDERFDDYMWAKAPELASLPSMALDQQQWIPGKTLKDLGLEVVKDQRVIMAGKLPNLHGHEIGMRNVSVNPARTAFLKCNAPVIVGHLHKDSWHSETDMHGKLITTWSTGCMCQRWPKFARINKWVAGFAAEEIDREGGFNVMIKRIYQGKVW